MKMNRIVLRCCFFSLLIAGGVSTGKMIGAPLNSPQEQAKELPSPPEEKLDFINWKIDKFADGGEGYIQEKCKKSGVRAALLRGTSGFGAERWCDVLVMADMTLYPVYPGEKLELSAFVKPTGTLKDQNSIQLRFFDKDKIKLDDIRELCGGDYDWKMVVLKTTVPEKATYVTPLIVHYRSAGECYFDDLRLTIGGKDDNILKDGGFENALAPAHDAWRFSINLPTENIQAMVDITDMKANEHLVHYNGKESLLGLTMELDYNVIKPANCYLTSDIGFKHWDNFNLATLGQSFVHSNEKIVLGTQGRFTTTIPFTERDNRYFDILTKGPNAIRSHSTFSIMSDRRIGETRSVDKLFQPEKSFFGNMKNHTMKFYRKSIYTLANLKDYHLEVSDFYSDWKPNGWCAFKLYVIDADGEKLLMNRADISVACVLDGKTQMMEAVPVFDNYDTPKGYFIGNLGERVPEKVTIHVKAVAATPRGKEIKSAEKSFVRGENVIMENPFACEKKAIEPDREGRAVFVGSDFFSQNPEKGEKQIKEMITKLKQCNFNAVYPFANDTKTLMMCDISNKYFTKSFPAWDPFAKLREATKKEGIALGAVICVLAEGIETRKGILQEHPEWAMSDESGNKIGWLDPSVPEVRAYRVKYVLELMTKYALDGIALDYCRLSSGSSDRGAEIYMKETGVDPRKAKVGSKEYIDWYIWTANHLTTLVGEIHKTVKGINPNARVSAYVQGVKCEGTPLAYEDYHQKFTDWMRRGYVDEIWPTAYLYDMLNFKSWCKRQITVCREANANIPCMPTIGVKSSRGELQPTELIDQINALRELGAGGQTFFPWEGALENLTNVVKEQCYTRQVLPPEVKK